jgi:hypothetical protein
MADPVFAIAMEFVTGSYTNVTSDVLRLNVSRELGTPLRGIRGGAANVELNNASRNYSPANSASPYYPYLRPQVPLRIQATHSGSTYNLFQGWVQKLSVDPKPGAKTTLLDAVDAITRLGNVNLVTSLYTSVNPSTVFTAIMSQCQVNSFASDAIGDSDTIDFAWYRDRDALNALRELVEFGRYGLYQDGSGTVQLKNRYFGFGGASTSTYSGQADVGWNISDTDAINKARVQAQPRRVSTGVNTVAWLREAVTIQASSGVSFWLTYVDPVEVSLPTPATSLTTPVTSTDFRAFTNSDGTGTDRTATLSASVALFAETAVCSLFNGSADVIYVTKFQIRGFAIQEQPSLTAEVNNSSSQAVYGNQQYALTSPLMGKQAFVQGYAESLVAERKDPVAQLRVAIKNEWPAALATEPGQVITVWEPETATNSLVTVLRMHHDVQLYRGLEHTLTMETEVAPNMPFLVLDHATKGKLDSGNTLAF